MVLAGTSLWDSPEGELVEIGAAFLYYIWLQAVFLELK